MYTTVVPKMNNLEIIEIDTRQIPAMIHLRWASLLSPLYPDIHYTIADCEEDFSYCHFNIVQLNKFCDLWDNYICYTIPKPSYDNKIKVRK